MISTFLRPKWKPFKTAQTALNLDGSPYIKPAPVVRGSATFADQSLFPGFCIHVRHYVMSSLQLLSAMFHDNAVIRTVFSWSNPTPPRPLGFWTLNPLPLTPLLPISDSECYDYDLDCLANVARDFGVPVPRGGRSLAGFGKLDLLKQATPSASHIPSLSNPFPPFP